MSSGKWFAVLLTVLVAGCRYESGELVFPVMDGGDALPGEFRKIVCASPSDPDASKKKEAMQYEVKKQMVGTKVRYLFDSHDWNVWGAFYAAFHKVNPNTYVMAAVSEIEFKQQGDGPKRYDIVRVAPDGVRYTPVDFNRDFVQQVADRNRVQIKRATAADILAENADKMTGSVADQRQFLVDLASSNDARVVHVCTKQQ